MLSPDISTAFISYKSPVKFENKARQQNVQPARSFARRQRHQPKLVQSHLIPQKIGHPAGTPLTRPTQPHGAQPDRHHIAIEDRRKTILGKQRDLFGLPGAFIEDLDRLAPRPLWLSLTQKSSCRDGKRVVPRGIA